ncbi:beta-ketoacyl synthase N-terminal-like domain-containing protein, partial [Streptomyces sp. NPDC006386]|uniref:beta-ketoacyl synthase N-terminal-like domain-containing protein n=1 Tax=Streptomyces sp. NPDC006386 TaxID=3156762 RepID=UPI0033A1411A
MAVGRDDRSVAVVGIGCRLPGGITDLDALWAALRDERDLIGEMPPDRFPKDRFVDPGLTPRLVRHQLRRVVPRPL